MTSGAATSAHPGQLTAVGPARACAHACPAHPYPRRPHPPLGPCPRTPAAENAWRKDPDRLSAQAPRSHSSAFHTRRPPCLRRPKRARFRHVWRRLPAGAGPPTAPLERRMLGGRTSMRSARVRRAPAPPRCRRRRSSCLAPRFPRFASACPDFNFEISGDRNPEIYTTEQNFKLFLFHGASKPRTR